MSVHACVYDARFPNGYKVKATMVVKRALPESCISISDRRFFTRYKKHGLNRGEKSVPGILGEKIRRPSVTSGKGCEVKL